MNELQSKLLEMMVDFDQFCRENHLSYYMIGGTMLGAYRHKGFIPWDDDMDIGMLREDYERFLLLAKTKLKEPYVLRHQSVEPSVPYAFAHIENKNTTCIEHRRNKDSYAGGVYLEIFPLDGCSRNTLIQKMQANLVKLEKQMLYALILDKEQKKRSAWKNMVVCLMRRFSSIPQMTRCLDETISHWTRTKSPCVCNLLGHWGIREHIPVQDFLPAREYEFQGHLFFGPANPKSYLTHLYGPDYMIPPSKEEQKSFLHPMYYMNLSLPYKEYEKRQKKRWRGENI